MIGLILASHGGLAAGLHEAASMILGPQDNVVVLAIDRGQDPAELRKRLSAHLADLLERCSGVLIMTDMFGGTPTNHAAEFLQPRRIEVLTGANLPMLLKFYALRTGLPLAELAGTLKDYGTRGIVLAGEILGVADSEKRES